MVDNCRGDKPRRLVAGRGPLLAWPVPFRRTSVAYSLTRQISPSLTVIASLDWNATRPSPPWTVT
ncbi:hypothetical protein D3C75_1162630 [compost metagenome]